MVFREYKQRQPSIHWTSHSLLQIAWERNIFKLVQLIPKNLEVLEYKLFVNFIHK